MPCLVPWRAGFHWHYLLFPAIAALAVLLLLLRTPSGTPNRLATADSMLTETQAREQASLLLGDGQVARARQIAEHKYARISTPTAPDKLAQAWWQNELGLIDLAQGQFANAITHFNQSLAAREELLGSHHADTALVLNNLGVLYNRLGRYTEAEPFLRRALAATAGNSVPNNVRTATTLDNLGLLYLSTGRFALAEEFLQRALKLSIRTEGQKSPGTATAMANLASLYITRQDFSRAEKLLLRTLDIDQQTLGHKNPLTAVTLNNLGELYRLAGRFDEAEVLYRRAIEIDKSASGTGGIDFAADVSNLASLRRQIGDFASAHQLLQQAFAIVENHLPAEHPLAASTLSDLAMLCLAEGRSVEAEKLLLRALQIEEHTFGRDHPSSLATLSSLAKLYAEAGRLRESEKLYRLTVAVSTTAFGKHSPASATAMNNLSSVLLRSGNIREAAPMLKASLAIAVREFGADSLDAARIEETTAQFHRQLGHHAVAETHFRRALRTYGSALPRDAMEIIWANHFLSEVLLDSGKLPEAYDLAKKAAGLLMRRHRASRMARLSGQSHDRRDTKEVFMQVLRAALAIPSSHNRPLSEATISAAVNLAEDDTGAAMTVSALQFAAPSASQRYLVHRQQILLAQLDATEQRLTSAVGDRDRRAHAQTAKLRNAYNYLVRQLRDIDATLHRNHPLYAAHLNQKVPTATQIHKALAADEAVVLLLPGVSETFALALTRTSSFATRVQLTEAEAASHVAALRLQLDPGKWSGSYAAIDRSRAHNLYRHLWQPLEGILAGKENVFVVASGPLASLPMALLVTKSPDGGQEGDSDPVQLRQTQWLIRRHALTSLPSLSSLIALRSIPATHQQREAFAGFGNPEPWHGETPMPSLPFAASELRSLAATLHASPVADIYMGVRATEAQVRSATVHPRRIVAFATHAIQTGEPGAQEAALLLNQPIAPTPFDDGIFRASEIAQLKLRADLVILSACNTAQAGSPALSLTRAFFLAGTKSLLVSHWPVWDRMAGKITTLTVANMHKHPDRGRAEALRQAMLSVLNDSSDPLNAHPSTWAAFALVGESRIDH